MNTIRTVQDQPGRPAVEGDVAALKEENELLLSQIQVVQEELERLHHAGGTRQPAKEGRVVLEDGRFPEIAAENLRYCAVVEAQREVHRLEGQHTVAGDLGEILIQGTTSFSAFLAMPVRLLKVWRKERKQAAPKELGGASFGQVISAYGKDGAAGVDALLASVSISSTTQANALTALARSLMHTEPVKAVEFARRAYSFEPQPFRLKWLGFRLHEAGELIEAEAMLEALPPDMTFSDSEDRQANRLRNEAKQFRLREALQNTGYAERRGKVEQQIGKLEQERREHAELAAQRGRTIEALEAAQSRLGQEKAALLAQHAEQVELAAGRGRTVDALKAARSQIEQEKSALLAQHAQQVGLAAERGRAVEALEAARSQLEQEKSAILAQHAGQVELAAERGQTVETLMAAQARLEQEKSALLARHAQQIELAAECSRTIETLKAAQAQLAQEKSALLVKHVEQFELAAERGRTIAALKETQTQLEKEKSELLVKHAELVKLVEERARMLELIKTAQAKQEEEKAVLRVQYAEQAKLAAERAPQIKALQEQIQSRLAMESELSTRQQGMQEELVKAEAQLDLIKDMLFRGERL
jgi:hypothetical protein